jgi:class 3 adenylate cyclase
VRASKRGRRRDRRPLGARVSAQAGPGEVLVSQTVKDLVAGSVIEFDDRGVHELKGVPGEWRLYAVAP